MKTDVYMGGSSGFVLENLIKADLGGSIRKLVSSQRFPSDTLLATLWTLCGGENPPSYLAGHEGCHDRKGAPRNMVGRVLVRPFETSWRTGCNSPLLPFLA